MEVKPVSKHVDWSVAKIGELATIKTGKRNTEDRTPEGLYPFFVRSQTVERINSFSFDGEAVLTAGDGVGTGKVFHYINGKFDYHQRVYKISDFSPKLNGFYFFLYFSTRFYDRIMSMTAKSSVDSVRMDMISGMEISLPLIEEQRAIAEALGDTDTLIRSLDELIAKKRNIKQVVMQQLLTGKKRLPGFSGEWKESNLGQIGTFSKGKGIRKDQCRASGLPCIRYGEIYTHHTDIVCRYYSFIDPSTAKESKRLQKGDILFAGSGETAEEIGKCVAFLSDEEVYAGGDIVILSPIRQDSLFLGYLLNYPLISQQKATLGQGDAVVHISARHLATIALQLPEPREQISIAEVLFDMDEEIRALELRSKKMRLLKQGMMQELLTGKTRLLKD
jgi:type I restriction enzyme S subunit